MVRLFTLSCRRSLFYTLLGAQQLGGAQEAEQAFFCLLSWEIWPTESHKQSTNILHLGCQFPSLFAPSETIVNVRLNTPLFEWPLGLLLYGLWNHLTDKFQPTVKDKNTGWWWGAASFHRDELAVLNVETSTCIIAHSSIICRSDLIHSTPCLLVGCTAVLGKY